MRRKTKLTWRYAYCITVLICSSLSAFADEEIEFVTETPLKFDNENAESIEYDKDLIDFKPLINNHGSVGLINNKTARFFEESSWSASLYKGSPDTRLNLTLYP